MKKLTFLMTMAIVALLFTSCKKTDYKSFVGTWGVEKIEYYNIDYAGNPIAASMTTYEYDYNDSDNGIQLIFRADKTGEMRDSAVDTLWIENEETGEYDTYIYCPDTIVVTKFSFSYDKSEQSLYMNMEDNPRPYKLQIENFTNDSFTYENEYGSDYMEKAYLKRISKSTKTTKSASRQVPAHPHKRSGSLFGNR
jgi:hypothetical protein